MTLSSLFNAKDARGLAIQSDGKVLISCTVRTDADLLTYGKTEFGLFRYNIDGSLDASFSGDGVAMASFSRTSADAPYAVEIQADGKIVVVGTSDRAFAAARFNTDGSLDTSFATGGMLTTNINSLTVANCVLIQPDGKIVLAGSAGSNFALARYNANGSLDNSFDGDGRLITSVSMVVDSKAFGIRQQADGKYLVIGEAYVSGNDYDFALVRYNTNGSLDTTFGIDGRVITPFRSGYLNSSGIDSGQSVALQSDGKILVAGYSLTYDLDGKTNFAVARYNIDGSLDRTFGSNGQVITDFSNGYDRGYDIALQADGKILVSGEAQVGTNREFAVARYNINGSLDSTFGVGGKATYDVDYGNDTAYCIAVQSNGKIIISGNAIDSASGRNSIAWMRLNSDGSIDDGTEGSGPRFLNGTPAEDDIQGGVGEDIISGGGGNDTVNGQRGIDTAIFQGAISQYAISLNRATQTAIVTDTQSGRDGTDTLTNIERLQFADKKIALDVTDNALETLQFIGVIAPSLQSNLNVRGTILSLFDQGKSMQEMSQLALDVGLITSDNTALAKQVFKNVFNTTADPDQGLTNTLVNFIEQNGDAKFLATVAGLNINVDLVGLQQHGMEFI